MRLVDADELMKTVFKDVVLIDGEVMQKELVLAGTIENAPTIDAEPVIHGHWAHLGGDEWFCSNCGDVIFTEGSWELPTQKYCSECGAKMDEVSE